MHWFSLWHSRTRGDGSRQNRTQAAINVHFCHPVTPSGHTMKSSAAACSVRPTAHASPYHALSMVMTQHFFRFLSLATLTLTPNSNLGEIFGQCTFNCQVSSSYIESFRSYHVDKQTDKMTNWQTNRRHWKHPPCFAALCRWVKIRHVNYLTIHPSLLLTHTLTMTTKAIFPHQPRLACYPFTLFIHPFWKRTFWDNLYSFFGGQIPSVTQPRAAQLW